MTILFLYHYPCADGVFSALAAYLSYRDFLDKCRFVAHTTYGGAHQSQELLDSMNPEDKVYLLDFIGEGDFPKRVSEKVSGLVILDHHKTAIEYVDSWRESRENKKLPENVEAVMDINRSGATIALDYFTPIATEDVRKKFFYVEDNDLWRHQLPNSKAFSHGLFCLKMEYDYRKNPLIFGSLMSLNFAQLVSDGTRLLEERDKKIASLLSQCKTIQLTDVNGVNYKCYSADVTGAELISALGEELAKRSAGAGLAPLGAVCFWTDNKEEVRVSLRSSDKDFDTTKISKHYKGGGHAPASGFVVSDKIFNQFVEAAQ